MIEEMEIAGALYNPIPLIDRMSRYAIIALLCEGKSVLDVGCGDGLGSAYLINNGASKLLGVDISHEEIVKAQHKFSSDICKFVSVDNYDLNECNIGDHKFDVIICSELDQNVSNFIQAIRRRLAPNGTILIGHTNYVLDVETDSEKNNTERQYSLREFQDNMTNALGQADQWLLGIPHTGISVLDNKSSLLKHNGSPCNNVSGIKIDHEITVLPTQNIEVKDSYFTIGIWNGSVNEHTIGSLTTASSYLAPWYLVQDLQNKLEDAHLFKIKNEELKNLIKLFEKRIDVLQRTASFELEQVMARANRQVHVHEPSLANFRSNEAFIKKTNNNEILIRDFIAASRAHRVANLYTRTAKGNNLFIKMFRFGKACVFSAGRAIMRRLRSS